MEKLSFKLEEGKHLLIPNNKISLKAQNISFEYFEKMQYDYIQLYYRMNDSERYINSNRISNFFVTVFLNNDGATFRSLIGLNHKGLMTKEELKNIKRDYEIAFRKKKNNEFRSFLLLDLLPLSNRRADAIIITNDYNIELYDFSEGKIVEKIKNNDSQLTESEKKQKERKQKQQERIDSYKGKISFNTAEMKDIILDDEKRTINYYNLNSTFYDFNYIYKLFKNNKYETTYIPNSLCFLITESKLNSIFYAKPLRANIDSPYFITELF